MSITSGSKRSSRRAVSRIPHRGMQSPAIVNSRPPAEPEFEPCASTASYLLYAQRNSILVLHHDTLAVERRCNLHRENVVWIVVDNSSERGAGRLAVSYDTGSTAIVWDILTGGEIARFSSYESMKAACFMRNGNIAFGNDQGNIILFEPTTSEHISARTIFDPITALAPSSDCKTFAIGYSNGSILIATLQPSFTILHTLTTTRTPSRIAGLAWHGSSSKSKTDMLATQTVDGDLRVWSVPKPPSHEAPSIIRVLQRAEIQQSSQGWFAWSKSGRIVQYGEGETRSWDVRTKKVSWEAIPMTDSVTGIANYGPTATLFTTGPGHYVRQYDIDPAGNPSQVASKQHIPVNGPPTPPTTHEDRHGFADSRPSSTADPGFTSESDLSSVDEPSMLSPMRKIAREMDSLDALESELRDKVGPLSPTSSRASSRSSTSTHSRRRARKYLYDQPSSSRASTTSGYDGTEFSISTPVPRSSHDNMSIRSASSFASRSQNRHRQSSLRREVLRSPEEQNASVLTDLFPTIRARMHGVAFRTPSFGNGSREPEILVREMLNVVFGWDDDVRSLINDEINRHTPGSAGHMLLLKWLGASIQDSIASMVSSKDMSSADWMILALYSIGPDSKDRVGDAYVQRLLEKGEIHPAVGILIGIEDIEEAVNVYIEQQEWLEATLLSCLYFPTDWQRISYLLRKWGETAMKEGKAELAVRLFSCSSVESSEGPASGQLSNQSLAMQSAKFSSSGISTRRDMSPALSPPLSPPSMNPSARFSAKNSQLKLITAFGDQGQTIAGALDDNTPMLPNEGVTPIAQSAMPYSAMTTAAPPWPRSKSRNTMEPASARTAMTPGGAGNRKRLPSFSDIERAKQEAAHMATPITAARDRAPGFPGSSNHSRRTSSVNSIPVPDTAIKDSASLPSPTQGVFARLRGESLSRASKSKPEGLQVQVMETKYGDPPSATVSTSTKHSKHRVRRSQNENFNPPPTADSFSSARAGAIDDYINSVEAAREEAQEAREQRSRSKGRSSSRMRGESRSGRAASRARAPSEPRVISHARRSPSSPIPMSPEEIAEAAKANRAETGSMDEERFYKPASPGSSPQSTRSGKERRPSLRLRTSNDAVPTAAPVQVGSRPISPNGAGRGRSQSRTHELEMLSPSAYVPPSSFSQIESSDAASDGRHARMRSKTRGDETSRERRGTSRSRRERSSSRSARKDIPAIPLMSDMGTIGTQSSMDGPASDLARRRAYSKRELAARELEERRLSLARRPSAPAIPLPGDIHSRPSMSPRANTEHSPLSQFAQSLQRSSSVDPEALARYSKPSSSFGLPATPRAMRHPRQMAGDVNVEDEAPPVPLLPEDASQLSSVLSSFNGSHANQLNVASSIGNESHMSSNSLTNETGDDVGPLLPSTVFGQKVVQPPPRSMSVPLGDPGDRNIHRAYKSNIPASRQPPTAKSTQAHQTSPPEPTTIVTAHPSANGPTSIDDALALQDQQVIIIPEEENPPFLPELQHLAHAVPPPPPPPPPPPMGHVNGSGLIDIVIDDNAASNEPVTLPSVTYPHPMDRAGTAPLSQSHRRGQNSTNESSQSISSRFRGIGDKMRSSSRNRAKSPHQDTGRVLPYESVPPPVPASSSSVAHHRRAESFHRAKSPYEKAMAAQMGSVISNASEITSSQLPDLPSLTSSSFLPGHDARFSETTIPPTTFAGRSASAMGVRTVRTSEQDPYGSEGGFL